MSTYKLNRGGDLWRLRVRLAGRDHYRHMHGSAEQADAALAAFAAELAEQGPAPAPAATPFRTWVDGWLVRHEPALAARTIEGYRLLLDHHLLPAIGAKRLSRITAADGLALQTTMLEDGLSPATVTQALRLGRAILADATLLRVIPANPWAAIRQRRRKPMPRAVIDPTQFSAVGAAGEGDVGELLALALATGLRRGELLALRWSDVRLADAAIEASGALEQVGGAVRRKAPKTAAGHRSVALPAGALAMLRARRLRAAEAALGLGQPLDTLPVFAGPDGSSWANPDTVSQQVRRALHRAGLRDSLHGLRHAHVTALLSAGINPRAVASRAGHSDVRTTIAVYGHALPRDEAAAVAVLDQALGA